MADIKQEKTLLQDFLESLEQVPNDVVKAALRASADEDEKMIINSFAPTIINQFRELSLHITEMASFASRQKIADVEKLLKMTSGVSLVKNLKLALPSIGSIIGKLGIDGIIKEIKKIIRFLLEILHINLPNWVDELIILIDQIFAAIFGGSSIKMKTALSQSEQNYLAELTQFSKLQKATRGLHEEIEEE